ncbi:MAG: hypothetical protein K9N51_09225, partial [Candidatus Pacebacteria bacterium]|nr:hypothetical protein [Candidatus Paceibacterota bacterium]
MADANTGSSLNRSLVSILERRGVLTGDQACMIMDGDSVSTQQALEEQLTINFEVDPTDICAALAEHARVPLLRLANCTVLPDLLKEFPAEMLKRHKAVPVARTTDTVTLAVADPLDVFAVEELTYY